MTGTWVLVAGDMAPHGGMDRANYELAAYLARRGDTVHVVAHRVAADLTTRPNVTVHEVRRPLRSHLVGSLWLDRAGREVARDVLRRDPKARVVVNGGNCAWPDVSWVHTVHHAWAPLDAGAPLSVRAKNRIAATLDRRSERRALGAARLVIANSLRTRTQLVQLLGLDERRVHAVYLGSDPDKFGPFSATERADARAALSVTGERPVVLFVGSLGYERRKGFDVLLAALGRMNDGAGREALLVAVGTGALDYWQRCIDERGLAARTRLVGSTERVHALLAASDLFVAPTRYEPYGLAVHEALCRGVPALVTRVAGIAERYPAALAELLLADPEDDRELATRMEGCLARRDALRAPVAEFGAELRRRRWEDMAREMVALIEEGAP